MRLLHIKLLSKFRGLPPGSEFKFHNTKSNQNRIEPICLVGTNGSGKSNLLEVICEIFYYLETYKLAEGKPVKKFQTGFAFEISFATDINYLSRDYNWQRLGAISSQGEREITVNYAKNPNELPVITLHSKGDLLIENSSESDLFILPVHVIAYSSGQNELISNPFIKSSYHYFETLEKRQSKDVNLELELSRLVYLDYESSQFITLCNYLFAEQNQVELINQALKIEGLDSFSLTIRFHNYLNNKIVFARTIEIAIENLKACATAIDETEKELHLAFKIDSEARRAFQRKFGSAILLFRDLFYLNLLNIHLHQVDTRRKIKDAPSLTYDNLSLLVPVPRRDKFIFSIDKIRFTKKNSNELIKYKNLSDGEHQLMHVLGAIMLLNTSGSILLFDEPETHFNPDWRSQLITLINQAAKESKEPKKIRNQEIVITSHSPFIVSDCRSERVFMFKNGKALNPEINTFGSSVDLILQEVFGINHSISKYALDEIKKLLRKNDPDLIIEGSKMLGESYEKGFLYERIEELKSKKKTKSK